MKNKIIKNLINKVTNLLVIMLLLTFILPYYVNADAEDEEKRQAAVPAAAAKVLEGITTVSAEANISGSSQSNISSGDGGAIVKAAKEIVDSIGNGKVVYGQSRNSEGFSSSTYVCASFVGEVIYRATNKEVDPSGKDGVDNLGTFLLSNNKFNLVYYKTGAPSVPDISEDVNANANLSSTIQPGDIVGTFSQSYTFQHALVYLGNDQYADMDVGTNVSIKSNFLANNEGRIKYIFRLQGNTPSNTGTPSGSKGSVISTSDLGQTGYTGVFKSGTTGREFKEYKQDSAPWSEQEYANSSMFGGGMNIGGYACCLVADAVLCSGYGHDMAVDALNNKYMGGYCAGDEIVSITNASDHFNSIGSETSINEVVEHLKKRWNFNGT